MSMIRAVLYQTGTQNALSATTGAAVSLTWPSTAGTVNPSHAIINVVGNSVRWRADGTAPTATSGILVAAGANIEFMDGAVDYTRILRQIQFIGISGTATLEVAFFSH